MATNFKNKIVKDAGILPIDLLSPTSPIDITVIGIAITNTTVTEVSVSITIMDDTSVEAFYVKDVLVPVGSSLRVISNGEKLIIPPDYILRAYSTQNDSLDIIISYVERGA